MLRGGACGGRSIQGGDKENFLVKQIPDCTIYLLLREDLNACYLCAQIDADTEKRKRKQLI